MKLSEKVQDLYKASKEEDKKTFYKLLKEIDLKEKDEDGDTALHHACTLDNAFFIQALIEKGATVEAGNNEKYRPLHIAAKNSTAEIVAILLDAGAKLDVRALHPGIFNLGYKFKSPLYLAVENKNFDTAKYLIERGAEVNIICDGLSSTPLTKACLLNHIPLIRLLLENGAIPNGLSYKNQGYHIFPLEWARSAEAVRILVEAGADINEQNKNRRTALHSIANSTDKHHIDRKGKMDALQALVDLGANPNIKDSNLRCTAYDVVRDAEVMKILLSSKKYRPDDIGLSLNSLAKEINTQSELDCFAQMLQLATKEDVLGFRPLYITDNKQSTILHRLFYSMRRTNIKQPAASAYLDVVKQLIVLEADVNAQEELWGYTVLQQALDASAINDLPPNEVQVWVNIITLLLEHGADKTINTLAKEGQSALDMAKYESIFDCLVAHGAVLGNYPTALIDLLVERHDKLEWDGPKIYPIDPDSLVKMLVSKGVFIKTTSILQGVAYNHLAYVFQLIQPYIATFGLDLNMPVDEYNTTLLHVACQNIRFHDPFPLETVRLLVEQFGLNINAQNNNGDTPLAVLLHAISEFDDSDRTANVLNAKATALYMLYKGASPDIVNKDEIPTLAHMTLKRFSAELQFYIKYMQKTEDIKSLKPADESEESPDINCELVYQDETSDKFWKIETNKNQYMVFYGRIGTRDPRKSGEVFASTERCIKEANKLISAKKKSGYTEIENLEKIDNLSCTLVRGSRTV